MQYQSTNHRTPAVDFRTAVLRGQAPDRGLYFPSEIPEVQQDLLRNIGSLSQAEIAFRIMKPYVGDCIPESELLRIVSETVDFPFPLVQVTDRIYSLELFHGPTLAFKDVGARFMSRCLGYFSAGGDHHTTVLVATPGDTGGAVANGFLGVEGVNVVILYPSGRVSPVQELQLTTCGHNITALEVQGSFDDCQSMVKDAFMDAELMHRRNLTSANSINIARWLSQQLYYFFAWKQWPRKQSVPVVAVPSGNLGNLCAGLLAAAGGLPVRHFIAACNANDAMVRYLATGGYAAAPAVATVSNAMDVGNPSNFVRILRLFGEEYHRISSAISGYSVTDSQTSDTIAAVYHSSGYTLDPHGAVAYHALNTYLNAHSEEAGLFLETAHPVKFPETVAAATGAEIIMPASVSGLLQKKKNSILIKPEFAALKEFLLG